jgi:hypothetical protein
MEYPMAALPALGVVLLLIYALVAFAAGFYGIAAEAGNVWALMALLCAYLFRFTLPLTVGAFVCAFKVWDWPWPFALLFAAPGLAFMFAGVVAVVLGSLARQAPRAEQEAQPSRR